MPFPVFVLMILTVIAAAGATIGLALWAGWPLAALGLAVLVASLLPGLRLWR